MSVQNIEIGVQSLRINPEIIFVTLQELHIVWKISVCPICWLSWISWGVLKLQGLTPQIRLCLLHPYIQENVARKIQYSIQPVWTLICKHRHNKAWKLPKNSSSFFSNLTALFAKNDWSNKLNDTMKRKNNVQYCGPSLSLRIRCQAHFYIWLQITWLTWFGVHLFMTQFIPGWLSDAIL